MANTIKIKNSGTANAAPSSLEYGELGLNYADGKIYFKNSSNVIVDYGTVVNAGASGATVTVSDTAPSGASVGDIWYESDTGKMFVYYDSFWVEASGSDGIGVTGATGATGTVDLASPAFTGIPTAPTASAGTNTTQIATMASRPWNTAWGIQTYTTSTVSDAAITTEEVQITGSSFTAVTGRLYKIIYFEPELYGATTYMQMNVRYTNISGTIRQLTYMQINGNNNLPCLLMWVGTLTAGTTNFVATLRSHVGTGQAYRDTNLVAFLSVEDIGPA